MKVAFAEFTLDSDTRQLARAGVAVHLSPKAFDLLVILLSHRPAVVDKDTLRERLWPGTNVVDANLNNLASEIRTALGDDAQQPRFIRTAHRVGYAFCGVEAEQLGGAAAGPRAFLVWGERRFMLTPEAQTIGRDPASAIWIDAPGVSRRHASISLAGGNGSGAATIEDLGSTNGTLVDGRPIRGTATLSDGQAIRIGEATLTFRLWTAAGASTKRIRQRS